MNTMPKVSVLIPTYNYGQFLDEAIESVLLQTYQNFELIIVDNCSTDNTRSIVEKYLCDDRVFYYCNEKNLGLVGNFNKCLEYARGEYIKYLMADDKFHPQLLEKYVAIMDQNPGVSLVTSDRAAFGLTSGVLSAGMAGLIEGDKLIVACLKNGKGNIIGEPTTVMFRKCDVARVSNFSASYISFLDLNLWLRLLRIGDCYIIPEVLSYFRIHERQASSHKDFRNWFDEYFFYKDVKKSNIYGVNLAEINIDKVVKKVAIKCARSMFRLMGSLNKRSNRKMFWTALKIAFVERVIISSFAVELHDFRKRSLFRKKVVLTKG